MAGGKPQTAPAPKSTPAPKGEDAFATGGEERTLAEPWTPSEPGEAMIARLAGVALIKTKLTKGDQPDTPMANFAHCVVRDTNGKLTYYGGLCLALGAGLRLRVKEADAGKVLSLIYDGEKPSGKGNPAKVYRVFEQTDAKHAEMMKSAGVEAVDDDLPF
jgi:hypothetical protein